MRSFGVIAVFWFWVLCLLGCFLVFLFSGVWGGVVFGVLGWCGFAFWCFLAGGMVCCFGR